MKTEIKITDDGSKTLFVPELNEHYHSTYGAVQESNHVFITAGLNNVTNSDIRIFEMGFGTGLNALLTCLNSSRFNAIEYHSMELFPLEPEIVLEMDYNGYLKSSPSEERIFNSILTCPWNELTTITPNFKLKKINDSVTECIFSDQFDLIYYDAFAPAVQPELWTEDIFRKLYSAMKEGSLLVTYCAKGDVRRAMQKCGFQVDKIPGPPGKHHMLKAVKK